MKNKSLATFHSLFDLPTYTPPGHSGTTNRRLVLANEAQHFEMVHGSIEPGGVAEEHYHSNSYQSIYILSGKAEVILNKSDKKTCMKGEIINIPPNAYHYVKSIGESALEMIIVYSPPISNNKG